MFRLRWLWSTGAASGSGNRGAFKVRGHNTSGHLFTSSDRPKSEVLFQVKHRLV